MIEGTSERTHLLGNDNDVGWFWAASLPMHSREGVRFTMSNTPSINFHSQTDATSWAVLTVTQLSTPALLRPLPLAPKCDLTSY